MLGCAILLTAIRPTSPSDRHLAQPGPQTHSPCAAQPKRPGPSDISCALMTPSCGAHGGGTSPGSYDLGSGRPGSSWNMATRRKPARRPAIEPVPAAERGEHWWPVATAIIVVAGLHVALPARYRVQPVWVVRVVLLALLAVLIAGDPGRIDRQKAWLRIVTGIVIGVVTVANLLAAVRLVVDILAGNKLFAHNPGGLLAAGGVIWATNVIAFALWYWDLDRGGAAARGPPAGPEPGVCLPGDAAHRLRGRRLGAA